MSEIQFDTVNGTRLAFLSDAGAGGRCGFFWLGGYKSDMTGSKAEALARQAEAAGRPNLRFDYSGHGASEGAFVDGTISGWLAEARHFFERTQGPQIVIGSSMGGWLATLLLRQLSRGAEEAAGRIRGLILIAPAADMTSDLMWNVFSPEARDALRRDGVYHRPSLYGGHYEITLKLIEDGQKHLLLHSGLDCPCPARILQGDEDEDVPPAHALRLFDALRGADISLTLVKGGDHRLSSPQQLQLICETAERLAQAADR